ncbi:MAG: LLM class flavin-dependent oxidoreductase [Polyangiaceae bacterium]|nr:LLM class flavin-dependent oxidoreductase [Polyangiaceae bacterium]
MIGVGVFRTSGQVLRGAGGVAGSTAVWLALGASSLLGAFVYADAARRVPEAGGPYAYVREAFGRHAAFADGWLAAAVSIPARQAAGLAAIGEIVGGAIGWSRAGAGLGVLAVLWAGHLVGVRAGANVQRAFTLLKLALIVAVVAVACFVRAQPSVAGAGAGAAAGAGAGASLPPLPLAAAVAGVWYAYLGWQDVTHLSEELERPARDLRPVLVGTVLLVAACYLAVTQAVPWALGDGEAARGDLPVAALAEAAFGSAGRRALTAAILVSMVGGAAEGMMVRPRLWFALARDGLAPAGLARVGPTGVPYAAMTAHALLVASLLASGSFETLLALLVLSQALGAALQAAAVVRLQRRAGVAFPAPAIVFAALNAAVCALLARQAPAKLVYALLALVGLGIVDAVRARLAGGRAGARQAPPLAAREAPRSRPTAMSSPDWFWFCPLTADTEFLGAPPTRPPTLAHMTSIIELAAEMGFTSLLTATNAHAEHDAWTASIAALARSRGAGLLVAVRPGMFHPAIFAKMAATAANLFPGRVGINVVMGSNPAENRTYGDFEAHGERYARAREFLTLVRRLWAEGAVDYRSERYQVEGAIVEPKPDPPVPIYLGGASDEAFQLAAELADVLLLWGDATPALAARLEAARAHARRAGRPLTYGLRCHVVVRETEAEAWAAAERLVSRIDPAVRGRFLEAARHVDSIGQRRQVELSSAPSLVVEPNLWAGVGLARSGVGVAIVGDPAQVEAKLRSYLELGFSTFILSGYPHWEECRRFGELVLPRFREAGAVAALGAPRGVAPLGAPQGVAPVT